MTLQADRTTEHQLSALANACHDMADRYLVRFIEAQDLGDQPAADAPPEAAVESLEDARWHEPAVAAQRILTEVFRSGGKTALELEDMLNRASVDPKGFIDYWAREQFLREVVRGRERRFELSKRAVLELELDVA